MRQKDSQNYIFIDEVQLLPNLERIVNSLATPSGIDLYITSTNSYIASSKIATQLSGRYVEIKIQPLTFSEFMQFFPDEANRTAKFQQFLRYGGFPEVANFLISGAEQQIPLYLQNIYSTVLEKDIKHRKQIRSMEDFRNVALFSFDSVGKILSPTKISNTLKSTSVHITNQTVDSYLTALQDCYLLYKAQRFDIRGKMLLKTLEKYYTVDLGLIEAVLGKPSSADMGRRLENIVYLELLYRYGQVWIGKNYDMEIDFVVKNSDGVTQYFQVAQTVAQEETLQRELRSLDNTGDHYKKTLLTLDSFDTDEQGIEHRNIINWLLDA